MTTSHNKLAHAKRESGLREAATRHMTLSIVKLANKGSAKNMPPRKFNKLTGYFTQSVKKADMEAMHIDGSCAHVLAGRTTRLESADDRSTATTGPGSS